MLLSCLRFSSSRQCFAAAPATDSGGPLSRAGCFIAETLPIVGRFSRPHATRHDRLSTDWPPFVFVIIVIVSALLYILVVPGQRPKHVGLAPHVAPPLGGRQHFGRDAQYLLHCVPQKAGINKGNLHHRFPRLTLAIGVTDKIGRIEGRQG